MAILLAIATTVVVLLIATVSEVLRRLFLHPLAHIPGPRLAALTWWYEFYYDIIQPGKYIFHIQELHKTYGPIVRITPDEIHINDPGFLDAVYAPSTSPRDKYEYQLRTLRIPGGVGATPSFEAHKQRREALVPYFSKKNVLYLESLIARKVEQLRQLIAVHTSKGDAVNLSDAFFAFSNDVAINFLFAHQTDVLADDAAAATLRRNSTELLKGVHINKHFPWLPDFLESLPLSISKPMMPPGLLDMMHLIETVRAELIGIMEAKASGKRIEKLATPTGKESVFDSVLDNAVLPPQEKSLLRLEQEGTLLVLAGTESPAKTLTIIFFHLAANHSVLTKLRTELDTAPSPASWTQLEQLQYLSAVIEEGNRLSFGVTARTARISRDQLNYTPSPYTTTLPGTARSSYPIPPKTPISITTLSVHTSEKVFPDPLRFDPERWLGEKGRELRKFQTAFSKGGRKCVGIELARAELYLVIAALVRSFDMSLFETDERDVAFEHDYQIAMPKMDSKGVRVVAKKI